MNIYIYLYMYIYIYIETYTGCKKKRKKKRRRHSKDARMTRKKTKYSNRDIARQFPDVKIASQPK